MHQVINAQLYLVDIPFLPLLEEIIDEQPVMALDATNAENGNEQVDMETDGTGNQHPNSPGFGSLNQ